MKAKATPKFWKEYERLPRQMQKRARVAYQKWGSDAIWVICLPSPPAPLPEGEGRQATSVVFSPLPLGEGPGVRATL